MYIDIAFYGRKRVVRLLIRFKFSSARADMDETVSNEIQMGCERMSNRKGSALRWKGCTR